MPQLLQQLFSLSFKMQARRDDYDKLFRVWSKAYSTKEGTNRKTECDSFWKSNKHDVNLINAEISRLELKVRSAKITLQSYFLTSNRNSLENAGNPTNQVVVDLTKPKRIRLQEETEKGTDRDKKKPCTVQELCKTNIAQLSTKIRAYQTLKEGGIASTDQLKGLKSMEEKILKEEKRLKTLQSTRLRQQEFRARKRAMMDKIRITNPHVAEVLEEARASGSRTSAGRPSLECSQPLLLKTIVDIVAPEAAADERRQSDKLRTCRTLDDLHNELLGRGFNLSRSALYLRLMPKNSSTLEGRRHISTVPVKLLRARNDGRIAHQDSHFCSASVKFLKDLAEILGPQCVYVISQDDRARVPMGIPAATKETPILMHVSYRVRLPDHDYPIASQHKLIPSVYGGVCFDDQGKLSYSGPTYIAIRSGKHDSSSAISHAFDFQRLRSLENFKGMMGLDGEVKPIIILFTDGGPDENPRYEGPLTQAIHHFKQFNLDAIFIATHAPGQSAFNQVERRMAPLSRDLAGIILPYDHYGTHLEGQKTVNPELEIRNFQRAGEVLCQIWNETCIDGHVVTAEYIQPGATSSNAPPLDEKWMTKHVQQSQYMLQVIKCDDRSCCGPMKTNLKSILQGNFLPGPVNFQRTRNGINCSDEPGFFGSLSLRIALKPLEPETEYPDLPFDYACPSIKNELRSRVCKVCKKYFPSKKAVGSHMKCCHKSSISSIMETIEAVVQAGIIMHENEEIPLINDIAAWMQCPFKDLAQKPAENTRRSQRIQKRPATLSNKSKN